MASTPHAPSTPSDPSEHASRPHGVGPTAQHGPTDRPPSASEGTALPDVAFVAHAFSDSKRAAVLMALTDGRALPAGRLASEAGVGPSTVSNHLALLLQRGLVTVHQQGRNRFYRLASPEVEGALEALARLAPQRPIASLREHTRSGALRRARTCYRHLAGRLGVALFTRMIELGWVTGGDGRHHPEAGIDQLSSTGKGRHYRLSTEGRTALAAWGLVTPTEDVPLRYCIDWTEQAHHLAGWLGADFAQRCFDLGWVERGSVARSLEVTGNGRRGLDELVGLQHPERWRSAAQDAGAWIVATTRNSGSL